MSLLDTSPQNISLLAAAKSLQSCPTLCDPIDGSPPGSAVPGTLQARTLEWAAISFSNAWKWKMNEFAQSCLTLSNPMDCSLPGSSVHGIFQARVLEWGAIAFSISLLRCGLTSSGHKWRLLLIKYLLCRVLDICISLINVHSNTYEVGCAMLKPMIRTDYHSKPHVTGKGQQQKLWWLKNVLITTLYSTIHVYPFSLTIILLELS